MNKSSGIVAFFCRHAIASKTLMLAFILGGLLGSLALRQEVFPPFAPARVDITIPVRGGSAAEIEQLIVLSIEQAISEIPEVSRITARAYSNYARIQIELAEGEDPDAMLTVIKSRVDGIASFPNYMEEPLYSIPQTTGPLLRVEISSDIDPLVLYQQAVTLRRELSLLSAVSAVEIDQAPELEVAVLLKPLVQQRYNLNFSQVAEAIRGQSVRLNAGSIESDNGRILVRGGNWSVVAQDFLKIPIKTLAAGEQLLLDEIAEVVIQPTRQYNFPTLNGAPSFTLEVRRNGYVPLQKASDQVHQFIERTQAKYGDNVQLSIWMDDSKEFKSRVGLLIKNGLLGFIIICFFMALFVNLRVAFWTAVGVPVSMLGALGLLYFSGLDISLNAITLFGFLTAIGLIVDDAIVIGESIHDRTQRLGQTLDNVVAGAQRVAFPTTFGALTSIAAFFPLTLTEGKMGSQMAGIGLIVILCLVASIIESKLILPRHLNGRSRLDHQGGFLRGLQNRNNHRLARFSQGPYRKGLTRALNRPWWVIAGAVVCLAISVTLLASRVIPLVTLPNLADYEIEGEFDLDPNLTRDQRQWVMDRMEASLLSTNRVIAQEYPDMPRMLANYAIRADTTQLFVDIELDVTQILPLDAHQVAAIWRAQLPNLPEILATNIATGPNGDEQIEIQLSGEDLTQLQQVAQLVKSHLQGITGVVDVRDSQMSQSQDVVVQLNKLGSTLGLTETGLLNQVRNHVYGFEAQRVQVGEEERRVMLRSSASYLSSIDELQELPIVLSSGEAISLRQVADIEYALSDSFIQRVDGQRAVVVYANTLDGISAESVAETVVEEQLPIMVAAFPGVSYGLEGAAKEANKSVQSLMYGGVFAGFFMLVLLAIPLRSYRLTFVILGILPMSFVGAIVGHLIVPVEFSLISMFGVIALMGVMVNNGLLLVDAYLEEIAQGKAKQEALILGCTRRLRPIMLTAVTTFAGLMPLLWETNPEALWLIPIAVSLGIGILVATGLTLVLLPSVLMLVPLPRRIIRESDNGELPQAVNSVIQQPPSTYVYSKVP